MDAKSLAKSKRAHSQHHQSKRPHPNQKPKASPTATPTDSNLKKPPGKQTREKSRQSGLPSNWDRYEDELGSEDVSSIGGKSEVTDVVVPKSKGADFGHLISEAQTQLESQCRGSSGRFASFDDVLPDFNQGVSSMLSVRGNSILSWIGDDNFTVDDNSTTGSEASFLSMDLHSLAAQLSKLDVSQRLFIEADILHPEPHADGSKQTVVPETSESEGAGHSAVLGRADDEELIDKSCNLGPSTATGSFRPLPTYHNQGAEVVDQVNEDLNSSTTSSDTSVPIFCYQGAESINTIKDGYKLLEQTDPIVVDSASVANLEEKNTSAFEAMAAEAELDMLLNSFQETKLPDSSAIGKTSTNSLSVASLSEALPALNASKPSEQSSNSSKGALGFNLDDTIDDLLNETSNLKNKEDVLPQERVMKPSQSTTKVLDDFDSWLDTI